MAKSLLVVGGSATFLQNSSNFCNFPHGQRTTNNSVEGKNQAAIRAAGTLSNLYVRVATNSLNNAATFRTRKNTANGSQSVSISSSTTGEFTDTSNTDSVSSGDLICYQMVAPSGSGSIEITLASLIFNPATQNSKTTHGSNNNTGMSTASSTFYIKLLSGEQQPRSTESEAQQRVYVAATLKNFQLVLASNGRTTTTTFGTRVNGGNGNQSVSVSGSATGTFHDSSNTDTLAATDLVNCYVTTGTGTGTISPTTINAILETTTGEEHNFAGHGTFNAAGTTVNANLTRYTALAGTMVIESTESRSSLDVPIKGRIKGLGTYVVTNTLTASTTLRTRVNAGNGAQSVSIGSGSTGFFEDTSNADTIAAGDNLNTQLVTGATGTSIIIQYVRTVFCFPAPISTTKSLKYSVLKAHAVTKSLRYAVAVEHSNTKSLRYAVAVEHAVTKSLTYKVAAEASVTKSLKYGVSTEHAVTKSLRYAVSVEHAVTKSLTYEIRRKMEVLQDNFDDDSIDSEWAVVESGVDQITDEGGELHIRTNRDGDFHFDNIKSIEALDLEGSHAMIELVDIPITSESGNVTFYPLSIYASNAPVDDWAGLEILIVDGVISCVWQTLADYEDNGGELFDPVEHRFVRIRASGGVVYWEKSSDCENWTTMFSDTPIFPNGIHSMQPAIAVATYDLSMTQFDSVYDNLNVAVSIESVTKSLAYYVATEQAVTKSLRYAVAVGTPVTKSLKYRIAVPHSTTKSLKYEVQTDTKVMKSLKYCVETTPAATTKSVSYRVATEQAVTKSLRYAVRRKWEDQTDRFDGPSLDPQWTVTSFPGTAPITVDGELTIETEDAGAQYSSNGIYSTDYLDLLDSYAMIEIVNLGPMLTGDEGYIAWPIYAISEDNFFNVEFDISCQGGIVYLNAAYYYSNGVDIDVFDNNYMVWDEAIRFVRIRSSGTTIYWEYSTDGVNWTQLFSLDASAYVESMRRMVVGPFADQYDTGTGSTREVVYDNWNVGVTEEIEQKSLRYAVSVEHQITKSAKYTVTSEQGAQKMLRYRVQTAAFVTLSLKYEVAVEGKVMKSMKYTVTSDVAITKGMDYRVLTQGAITKQAKYSVRSPESSQKGLSYKIVASGDLQKSMTYHVASASAGTKSLKYAVRKSTAIQLSLTYARAMGGTIHLSLRYEVSNGTKITKSLRYVIRHSPYTPKPGPGPYVPKPSSPFSKKNSPYTALPPLA